MFTLLAKQGGIRYEVAPGGQKVYDPHEIDRYMAERQGKPIPEGKLVFYVRDGEGPASFHSQGPPGAATATIRNKRKQTTTVTLRASVAMQLWQEPQLPRPE